MLKHDVREGESLNISVGGIDVKIRLEQKSGKRSTLVIDAPPEVIVTPKKRLQPSQTG